MIKTLWRAFLPGLPVYVKETWATARVWAKGYPSYGWIMGLVTGSIWARKAAYW